MLKYLLWLIAVLYFPHNLFGQAGTDNTIVYLFPGQGADYRLFKNLTLNSGVDTAYIHYKLPLRGESLKEFAYRHIDQIDTSKNIVLVGVSLGGMMCSELTEILNPEKTILISSAKHNKELPVIYRLQKHFPISQIMPRNLIKVGFRFLQPLVEPDSKNEEEIFSSMTKSLKPVYYKRTVNMIINWDKKDYSREIVHIHGTCDNTIPIRNVNADYIIKGGSHMMILTEGEKVSDVINTILSDLRLCVQLGFKKHK